MVYFEVHFLSRILSWYRGDQKQCNSCISNRAVNTPPCLFGLWPFACLWLVLIFSYNHLITILEWQIQMQTYTFLKIENFYIYILRNEEMWINSFSIQINITQLLYWRKCWVCSFFGITADMCFQWLTFDLWEFSILGSVFIFFIFYFWGRKFFQLVQLKRLYDFIRMFTQFFMKLF